MPRNKSPIVKKETRYRKNKDGKNVKSGVNLTREDGTTFSLLNPSGKAAKYFVENQRGKLYTNAGELKKDKDNKPLTLTKEQKAYRSGYLDAQKDNAKAYKAKKAKSAAKKAEGASVKKKQ